MPDSGYSELCRRPRFAAFIVTQFLGAFNDNLYLTVLLLLSPGMSEYSTGGSLALTGTAFILPFLLFSGYAGYAADAFSKRAVLIATKLAEVFIMSLALAAFLLGSFHLMLAVLFSMSLQSTFFSPAKYGILPEIAADSELPAANGVLQMSTNVAIIGGTWAAGELLVRYSAQTWTIGVALTVIAVLGALTSFGIPRVSRPSTQRPLNFAPWHEINSALRSCLDSRWLWGTLLGISYFFFLGALLKLDLILYARDVLGVSEEWNARLISFLGIGIGLGSLLAGGVSAGRISTSHVRVGLILLGTALTASAFAGGSYLLAALAMGVAGIGGGFFVVPLNALLQQQSHPDNRGAVMAANSFLNTVGVLLATGLFYLGLEWVRLGPDGILAVSGALTFAAAAYAWRAFSGFEEAQYRKRRPSAVLT